MLSEQSQTQKATYCMTSFVWKVQNRQTHSDSSVIAKDWENPRDSGAWWAAVYGVAQSQTWLTQHSSSSSSLHQVAKYWSLSISPCNEYSGLISSRIDWSDLLVIQGTLKSLLQSHSWKASVLWCSVSLLVQKWEHNMEGPTSWRSQ